MKQESCFLKETQDASSVWIEGVFLCDFSQHRRSVINAATAPDTPISCQLRCAENSGFSLYYFLGWRLEKQTWLSRCLVPQSDDIARLFSSIASAIVRLKAHVFTTCSTDDGSPSIELASICNQTPFRNDVEWSVDDLFRADERHGFCSRRDHASKRRNSPAHNVGAVLALPDQCHLATWHPHRPAQLH
jgi:hypothetical protein